MELGEEGGDDAACSLRHFSCNFALMLAIFLLNWYRKLLPNIRMDSKRLTNEGRVKGLVRIVDVAVLHYFLEKITGFLQSQVSG